MSTLKVNAITDASGGNTATINSMTPTADSLQGFRNRIINGDMRIDQRNAGAAVTIDSTANTYTLDRWNGSGQNTDGVFTVDQVTDVPTGQGFTNSAKITVTTADASIGSDQLYLFSQFIEGNNFADAMFGTASAKTITISFWVQSSVTGTFGGALNNSANNRNYPFTYSISSANTWEKKTITVAGDTTGTWLTDTDRGIGLRFSFGCGSNRVATAGAWTGTSSVFGATGQTQLISTLNATWYITGVQLEVGSVATPFERRDYGRELIMCQRYFQKSYGQSTAIGTASTTPGLISGKVSSTTVPDGEPYNTIVLPVTMRATPTVTIYGYAGGSGKVSNWAGTDLAASSGQALYIANNGFVVRNNSGGTLTAPQFAVIYHYIASDEL